MQIFSNKQNYTEHSEVLICYVFIGRDW